MDLSYVLYDTLSTGTAAFESLLFQVAQGADTTHTEDFTNMRGAGSLPSSEKFTIKTLGVSIDPAITPADISKLFVGSFLQLRVYDQVLLWVPLVYCIWHAGWQGFSNLTAAAGLYATGSLDYGFMLENPIELPPGAKFAVRVKSTQATAASTKVVVGLQGILTLP